ncbi:DEAD/DEAH box helicase [Enterovibrio norvegicus]|uniref:DEAD/DEAH box helicase n=1 Tax=Enterovibrio norvegicus TaxID=188144 RepID=UPI0002E0F227|nr:DEAD/DEAH box helicase [Enterovibrio norvegicus]OEE43342.1 DEAD/DEAH box helicase [Enterovibrio norvegicus]PMI29708.1 DEAD/DEAH box helicase [Enterovibrio norvegicus]
MSDNAFTLLNETLQSTLSALGYAQPTDIQQQAIPKVLAGKDVMGAAQTGTGKTAAFTLPLIHQLLEKGVKGSTRVLVVTPTRELAQQVLDKVAEYSQNTPLKCVALYGGANINPQKNALAKGAEIVVGTPGRLLDHLHIGTLNLGTLDTLVLDEADRMLDMGFISDIKRLMKKMPKERQTLFFSATYPKQVMDLAYRLLNAPVRIEISTSNSTADTVEQLVHPVDKKRKRELLSYLIGSKNLQQVLVFAKTRQSTEALANELKLDGLEAEAIHGEKTQGARNRALEGFKSGEVRVLVATDVAARGLDIPSLDYVFNYELPHQPEDYIHRIGRTGRAGKSGKAISLVSREEEGMLVAIETLIDQRLPQEWLEGYEPDLNADKEHHEKRGGRGGEKRRLKRQLIKKSGKARR